MEENEFLNDPKINTPNNKRKEKSQRRSQSQRAIHKPKVDQAAMAEQ